MFTVYIGYCFGVLLDLEILMYQLWCSLVEIKIKPNSQPIKITEDSRAI